MAAVRKIAAVCGGLLAVLWLVTSPLPAARSEQGILEIQIKDHRDAIDDFARLNITIEKILISPKAGLGFWPRTWKDLGARSEAVDLTKYVGKKTARVFRSAIDAGSFDAFHLKLKGIEASFKKPQRAAAVKNTIAAVQAPFEVPARGETVLVIDLVVTDFSDHPPRGYELAIRGYEIYTNGKLRAKIPPG
jgi:hypothetical protein